MNYSGYVKRNSIIHKMNPSIKFIISIIFIVLIFIPAGFFLQTILLVIIISLFFLAKIPFRKFLYILMSIIFMILILFVLNWLTYKSPGVIFNFNKKINSLIPIEWFLTSNSSYTKINDDYFLQGFIWGNQGPINKFFQIMDENQNPINLVSINGFIDISMTNSKTVIDFFNSNYENYKIIRSPGNDFLFIYESNWYSLSSYAITLTFYVSIKIFLMILIVTILTATTSAVELTYALEDLLSPLKIFKLPITVWSMMIALGIRFIPSLLDESDRILKAQASRGLDFKNGNFRDKVLALTSFIIPLFSIAFKKADELANAMEARGYDPELKRTRYREYKVHYFDFFVYFFLLIITFFVITLNFIGNKSIFYSPFGLLDAITMFGI